MTEQWYTVIFISVYLIAIIAIFVWAFHER